MCMNTLLCLRTIAMFHVLSLTLNILHAVGDVTLTAAAAATSFTYNGFSSANLILNGAAAINANGSLVLADTARYRLAGTAFYPTAVAFKNSQNRTASSFSTNFAFTVFSPRSTTLGQGDYGVALRIEPPSRKRGEAVPAGRGVTVAFDGIECNEDNYIIIRSTLSAAAGHYEDNSSAVRGQQPMQAWVEYDSVAGKINVALAQLGLPRPEKPNFSLRLDLSWLVSDKMYVGFSFAAGSVLGWSFSNSRGASQLNLSKLPQHTQENKKQNKEGCPLRRIELPLITALALALVALLLFGVFVAVKLIRKTKFEEVVEDWEMNCGANRFKYKDLHFATNGFTEKGLLGRGGFGKVYRGVLPTSEQAVAVKRVSNHSRQGVREFVAEISSVGRLRHRNIVPLLGYCRGKSELLLVYDYMPNGSLDTYLHGEDRSPEQTLSWARRFHIIKGVASALLYLHEGWDQVVVHRDVKASNILLDRNLNGRLGDFGLARRHDHGADPLSTRIVGTLGYIAPELNRTGMATCSSDVFAFGAFLLEVACGRRPIEPLLTCEDDDDGDEGDVILVDWVFSWWEKGRILEASDERLWSDGELATEELEMVMSLGLMCLQLDPAARPTMQRVVRYLEREVPLPDLVEMGLSAAGVTFEASREGFDQFTLSFEDSEQSLSMSVSPSVLSGGR